MSENTTAKKSNRTFIIAVIAALVVLGAAYYIALPTPAATVAEEVVQVDESVPVEETAAADMPEAQDGDDADAEQTLDEQTAEISSALDASGFDLAVIKAERVLGNPSAPIKISEFASLTCSHCAQFHKESLPKVKAEMLDAGKAYLVFSDFPLNAAALHASMVARCLPQDKYFDFIGELFATQEEWAFDGNYLSFLKGKASQYGLPEDRFQACVNSKAIQESVVERMRAAQSMWKIDSTPSFVINNKTVISGSSSPEEFIKSVNAAAQADAAPASTEPSAGSTSEPQAVE